MRKVYALITLLLFLFGMLLCFMVLTSADAHAADTAYSAAEPTTHHIVVFDVFELEPDGKCSATAVGPYALLTAGHCATNSADILVDGKSAKVDLVMNDGHEHAIMILDGIKFDKYATIVQRKPETSENVFIIGNPKGMAHQYRRGYVMGTSIVHPEQDADPKRNLAWYVLDMNGFFGDSGAAVFDAAGKIISAVSFRKELTDDKAVPATFMGLFELSFTSKQLEMSRGGR